MTGLKLQVGAWRTLLGKTPESTKAILFLLLVAISFAYPFFLQGKQFSPMDLLYSYYPWEAVAPDWYEHPTNALRWDDASKYYPIRTNLVRNFEQDGLSFWQTDHLFGTPNRPTINWYGELFYPLVWLFFVLPFKTANSLIHILNLVLAGVSMWFLLKEHRLRPLPALTGAVIYMLNGFFVVWMSAFFLPGMLALLPLAFLLFHRVIYRRKFLCALWAALVIAFQFYLGYPPGSIVFLMFSGLYCMTAILNLGTRDGWDQIIPAVRLLAVSLTLGIMLSALYLLPALQQLSGSEYMVARGYGERNFLKWEVLLGFLFPDFWGNPTNGMAKVWYGWGNYCEIIAYFGASSLVISLFGLFAGRKHGQLYWFSALSLAIALSMAYGLQPLSYLIKLPGVAGINTTRWHFGILLAGSLCAAQGLEYLMSLKPNQRRSSAFLLLAIALGWGYVVVESAPLETVQARFANYPQLIQSHLRQIGLASVCLALVGFYILLRKRVSGRLFGILCLGLIVVDLMAFGVGFNPYLADEELYPTTPGIRFLQSRTELFRIVPWKEWTSILPVLTPNVYGISSITGVDHYRDLRYRALLEPLMSESFRDIAQRYGYVRLDQNLSQNRPILDMLNVQYVVTVPEHMPLEQLRLVYQGPELWIYENPFVLPRSWGVSEFAVTSNTQALVRAHEAAFNPRQLVLLETNPDLNANLPPCRSDELAAEVVGYAQDKIVAQTDFACDGILVFSERYADGWQATVDGAKTEVLRANYLLRAVAVPAGKHTVQLYYRPVANMWGLGISLFSFILFCGMIGFGWKRWRGAAGLGITIPLMAVLWFARPWQQPPPPSERWVQVDGPERPEIAPHVQQAIFRDEHGEIRFLGYELNKTALAPGETLRLTLLWQGKVPTKQDYTVFTHLIDESGQLWGQDDHPPLDGQAPTFTWQNGQIISDIYRLTVDPNTAAETVRIQVGMYDWQTGERLPLFSLADERVLGDALTLDIPIQIQR